MTDDGETVCELRYHPLGVPVPDGWALAGPIESHHGHWSCLIERVGAVGVLDPDPPGAGSPDHAHACITIDGRLCLWVEGKAFALDLGQRGLLRIAAEATGAALRKP